MSDESDNEEEGEAETPEDHEDASSSDDDDEADVFALSGANRKGNIATSRLAGPTCMIETDAVAGAEEDTDSDDEEGYDVLDDDDDEDDDEDDGIEKVLEKDLIQDFLDEEAEAGAKRAQATTSSRPQTATSVSNEMTGLSIVEDAALARRLSLQSEDSNGGDLDWSEDPFQGLQTNDSLYQELIEDAEDDFSYDLASWRVTDETVNEDNLFELQPAGNEKRVRFAETVSSRSSSLSSEDDPRDAYPDLFDGTSTPQSRSQYMMDIDPIDDDNDDNESIFDFDYVDPYENEPVNMYNDEESDSDGETTDESDGDSTDEEDEADAYSRMHAIHKQNSELAAKSLVVTPGPGPTPASTPVSGKAPARQSNTGKRSSMSRPGSKPRIGTFTHDPTRAAVTADENGNGVKIACPSKPAEKDSAYWEQARQAMGSRDGSPGEPVSWTRTTPHTASIPQRPFTAKMTLGSMFDGNLDFLRNNDVHGITKGIILPAVPRVANSVRSSFTATNTLASDTPMNNGASMNLEDFVQYSESDCEMDVEPSSAVMTPGQDVFASFTNDDSSPMPRLDTEDLLDHFDQVPGGISSFRNNQRHVRQVSSLAANPASRAQTSEANALQKGRRNAANAPITPGRKSRPGPEMTLTGAGVRKPLASPLAPKRGGRSRGNSLSQTLALDRFGSNAM